MGGKHGMEMTGAEIVWECLIREGVDLVFGYPGGAILPTYDALSKYPQIHHVLPRHEQGASHMADGYARATGKVGVAMATSGPGATNLVTGLATAMLDSSPIVCLTGQVPTPAIGYNAFQEADITGKPSTSRAAGDPDRSWSTCRKMFRPRARSFTIQPTRSGCPDTGRSQPLRWIRSPKRKN